MKPAHGTLKHHAWGSDPKGKYRDWLARRARSATFIAEVGVWAGTTTRRLARATSGRIWAIDHWLGVPGDAMQQAIYRRPQAAEARFRRVLAPEIKAGKVMVLKMASRAAADLLLMELGRVFDLVFIDADHSYTGTRDDIVAFRRIVRKGGILAGHDIGWPGVREAVEEYVPGWKRGPGTLWFQTIPGGDN